MYSLSGCSLVWLKAPALGAGDREFESHHPDQEFWRVDREAEGSGLLNRPRTKIRAQVRILYSPPEICGYDVMVT